MEVELVCRPTAEHIAAAATETMATAADYASVDVSHSPTSASALEMNHPPYVVAEHQLRPPSYCYSLSPTSGHSSSAGQRPTCTGCTRPIADRWLLESDGRSWHEDCLRCSCCSRRLIDVGRTMFTRADLLLCRRDYLRLFGPAGCCSACFKQIPAGELVMRAKHLVFHLECFACNRCHHRFCVGDRYYVLDGHIVCEYDTEQLVRHTSCYGSTSVALRSSPLLPVTDEMSASFAPIDSPFLSPEAAAATGGGGQAHGAMDLRGMQMELGQQQYRLASVAMTPGAAMTAAAAAAISGSDEYRCTPELLSAQCAGDDRSSGYGSPSACSD